MKKALTVIGVLFIIAVIIFIIAFLGRTNTAETVEAPPELAGTWKLYQRGADTVDNEYFVFSDTQATDYRDGKATPYAESAYSIENNQTLVMEDISKEFYIKPISDNNIFLIESGSVEWKLFRVEADGQAPIAFADSDLIGSWNVIVHSGNTGISEKIIFDGKTLADYRDGKESPYLESPYTVDNRTISANGTQYTAYWCNANTLILLENGTNYLWELQREEK